MKKTHLLAIAMLAIAFVPGAFAQDLASLPAQSISTTGQLTLSTRSRASSAAYRSWKISLVPVIASQALDTYSSYGLRELNPVLAGPDQRFSNGSALIKIGVAGALIGAEYLIVRKHPGAARVLWKLNIVSAAITGATAGHNLSIH
jgi:hypothetical protein